MIVATIAYLLCAALSVACAVLLAINRVALALQLPPVYQ